MLKVLTLGDLPELDMQLDASVRAKCQKLPGSVQREHKLLSYSGVNLLFGCPRKYQLSKAVPYAKENTVHTAFGSAFGAGVQTYLVTGSKDYAIVAAASAWHMGLFDSDAKSNKSLATCVLWLEKWIHSYGAHLLTEYKVFEVEGKPAIELAGCITLGNGYSYRMFVDAVLQDRESGELLVLEIKTTGSVVDPVTYHMSDQGTGYGVLVDALAKKYNLPSSFSVAYMVLESKTGDFAYFPFVKSAEERVRWIAQQCAIAETIETIYNKFPIWPTRGNHCVSYGRACQYAGSCTQEYLIPPDFGTYLPKEETYDFVCSVDEALNTQFTFDIREDREWLQHE